MANLRRWLLARAIHPDTATRTDVLAFLEAYRAHASQASLVRRFAAIRFYYAHVRALGLRPDDPTEGIHFKQARDPPKQPFTRDEIRLLLSHCRRFQERAVVLLFTDTGLRLAELTGIRRADLDSSQRTLRLWGKGGKQRIVVLGELAFDALSRCFYDAAGSPRDYPWYSQRTGEAMKRDGFYRMMKRLGGRAGIERVFPRRFRTSWACLFLDETDDPFSAQIIMGHSKLETTLRYASWAAGAAIALVLALAVIGGGYALYAHWPGGDANERVGVTAAAIQQPTPGMSALSTSERDNRCYRAGWGYGYDQGKTADVSLDLAKARVDELTDELVKQLAGSVDIAHLPERQQERCARVSLEGWSAGLVAYRMGEDAVPPDYSAP